MKISNHRFLYITPFLMGVYPVLALLSANMAEITLSEGVRALLVSFFGTGVLFLILAGLLRNWEKAAVLIFLIILLFFTYGHVYLFLEGGRGLPLGRHRYLAPIYLVIFFGAGWALLRSKRPLIGLVRTINLVAMLLVVFPIVQMSYGEIRSYAAFQGVARAGNDPSSLSSSDPDGETLPDIYYIILDGYPRADILRSTFNFDNDAFLNFLTTQGFYVAPCSQSNYSMTSSSMASSLNMKYIHEEANQRIRLPEQYVMKNMIQNSEVQAFVEAAGYTTVSFDMHYDWLKWAYADRYLSPFDSSFRQYMLQTGLNEFELLLVKTSAALIFMDMKLTSVENQPVDVYSVLGVNARRTHQERLSFMFDTMMHLPETIPGPKFVYAHFISPHPPFIFDAEGNFIENERPGSAELAAYRDQIIYLNTRMEEIVNALLTLSEQPPILIIQGDHGAMIDYPARKVNKYEKLANLSAFYFPDQDYSRLYPTITPVNTFRVVFDQFLSADYELLEDRSYFNAQPVQWPCSE